MALTIGAAIATETMKCRKKAEKVCFNIGSPDWSSGGCKWLPPRQDDPTRRPDPGL